MREAERKKKVKIAACLATAWFVAMRKRLFFSVLDFPQILVAQQNWKVIASEIPPFDPGKEYPKRSRFAWNNDEGTDTATQIKSTWMQGWQGNQVWYNFPLIHHNHPIDKAEAFCPKTIAILKQIPYVQIAGYSMLVPHSKLSPHVDDTGMPFGSMAVNMPLTTIDDGKACLYVLDQAYEHKTGKAVIFDSTNMHSADNNSDFYRVILYLDFKI